ncbi:MAG: hypothetical protein HUJ26_00820 [Planctomycetaceae bacterium]|nr:hypothetical protein [Planctomycetaceae bacterium]
MKYSLLSNFSFAAMTFLFGIGFVSAQEASKSEESQTIGQEIAELEKALTRSRWDLGKGEWQQFLPDMKTNNRLNRTGNWVVTDEKTALTGGRGDQGAIYVWKFDGRRRQAIIWKYNRDNKYERAASRSSQKTTSETAKGVDPLRKSLTDSTWDLGKGDWQQFMPEMKTTNRLNRTGNWVVTDEKTALTGGRGSEGAIYIWKFDETLKNATITKYVRDTKYSRSARRIR